MDFFDDDATSRAPTDRRRGPGTTPQRRRPDRRRLRTQRLAFLAVVLFLIVFGLAWWGRSCQHSRKVGNYRTYFEGVATAIGDSDALGKQFNAIVGNPTRLSRQQMLQKLDELASAQDEIAIRVSRLDTPSSLDDQQTVFATGMRVRASGFKLLRAAMLGALTNKRVGPYKIAALDGYFSGPDAYYMDLVYLSSRTLMADDGVTDVVVPVSDYYLNWKALDPARLELMLNKAGSSAKLRGIHGVALAGVEAQTGSGNIQLVKGQKTSIATTAALAFVVTVENQGSVTEKNVTVTATLTLPDGSTIEKSATIASIASGQKETVTLQNWNIPAEALSKVSTLKVTAGPVPGERVASNNSASYKLILEFQ